MTKRKRKLQPVDFECRALAAYARSGRVLNDCLSTSYEQLPDGRQVVAVRSRGAAIAAYQVNESRLRKINLPMEFW